MYKLSWVVLIEFVWLIYYYYYYSLDSHFPLSSWMFTPRIIDPIVFWLPNQYFDQITWSVPFQFILNFLNHRIRFVFISLAWSISLIFVQTLNYDVRGFNWTSHIFCSQCFYHYRQYHFIEIAYLDFMCAILNHCACMCPTLHGLYVPDTTSFCFLSSDVGIKYRILSLTGSFNVWFYLDPLLAV